MRDLNVKKDSDRGLKILAVLVLGGTVFLVLAAAGVGWWMWWMMRPPQVPQQPPAVSPLVINPQPGPAPIPPDQLHDLPPLPPRERKPAPPPPAPKRLSITAVRSFSGHTGAVFSAAFSPDGRRILSGGADRALHLWERETGKELARLDGPPGVLRAVAFSPSGEQAVSAGEDGNLRLWNLAEKKLLRTIAAHRGSARGVAFSPDGKQLLSGGADRCLRVWEVETGKRVGEFFEHDAPILCVSVSSDGARALTGSEDGGALCWDLRAGRPLCFVSIGKPVHFALFAADGKRGVLGGDALVRLCDLTTGEQWEEGIAEGGQSRGGALLPGDLIVLHGDGPRLVSRYLRLRHRTLDPGIPTAARPCPDVDAHTGAITCVRVSPDGRFALTAGMDGAVKLWSITERDGDKNEGK